MAALTIPANVQLPDVNAAIQTRGPEFALGMDIPRQWATGVQAFITPETSILVFREQNVLGQSDGSVVPVLKNVASVIIPTDIVRDLHRILGEQLAIIDGAASQ